MARSSSKTNIRRRHHNRHGLRQIKNGKTERDLKRLAKTLRIPYYSYSSPVQELPFYGG